jgi:hypothetical protein
MVDEESNSQLDQKFTELFERLKSKMDKMEDK